MRFAHVLLPSLLALPLIILACSDAATSSSPNGADEDGDASTKKDGKANTTDGTDGAAEIKTCVRQAKAPDHARKIVVSHPYTPDGKGEGTGYELIDLSEAGKMTKTNQTFDMGPSFDDIAFTPDGEIGISPQSDGTLGVFKIDATGAVTVLSARFSGNFYASHVVVAGDGTRAFVIDNQTKDNNGGIHEVKIACDGNLFYSGLLVPGGQAHAMALMPSDPQRAVLAAGVAFDSAVGQYVHRIDFATSPPARLMSGTAFGDNDAQASWVAVTPDSKWALITDDGYSKGNRMVPVKLDTMTAAAPIAVQSPAGVAMSPFGNAALLLESDTADALKVLSYDPNNATTPFTVGAEVAYTGPKTSLPNIVLGIDRGTLKGRVFVSEVEGVRQLEFAPAGTVTDLGRIEFSGVPGMVGAIGVQP